MEVMDTGIAPFLTQRNDDLLQPHASTSKGHSPSIAAFAYGAHQLLWVA